MLARYPDGGPRIGRISDIKPPKQQDGDPKSGGIGHDKIQIGPYIAGPVAGPILAAPEGSPLGKFREGVENFARKAWDFFSHYHAGPMGLPMPGPDKHDPRWALM